MRHCNKRHRLFFSVCLFFLLTITGGNEAIIVELKALGPLNGTFITSPGGSHHYLDFSQLQKMVPALTFISIIIATNAYSLEVSGTGMLWPFLTIFTQEPFFLIL